MRIAFRQDQQASDPIAVEKHEAEFDGALRLPAFADQSVDEGDQGAMQVGARFEAPAFNDFPLQVEEHQVARGLGAGINIVMVAGHRESFANRG